MCGISGKTDWSNLQKDSESVVNSMCKKLFHRGPDNQGLLKLDYITLGHTRLSIIDLSANANQPMQTSDGRYTIVYNGEVYNFKEIKNELAKFNFEFKSNSDTEVILYAYSAFGTDCFKMFNGMFALAIWDSKKRELILAKDRFGKKPLYYFIDKNRNVTFASELNALTEDKTIKTKVSPEAVNCYLALGYILSPMTLYENIYKLEPSTYIKISDNGKKIEKRRYWNYEDEFRSKTSESETEIGKKIIHLLDESVKRRMISDVPVGAFLSGGVDSSSVVAFMKKHHNGDLHTFSVGFSVKSYNELPDADQSAKWLGTKHHGIVCKVTDGIDFINEAIIAYDEPFADNSLIPMIEVSKVASDYVTVVLSGDGADEIFAGYETYKADKYYNFAKPIPDSLKKFLIGLGGDVNVKKKISWHYKQRQFFNGTLHTPEKAHYLWRQFFSPEERVELMGSQNKELVYDTDPFNRFKKFYDKVNDLQPLDKNLYVDAMTWLTDDILVKVDRATMYSSIESRSPYLDPQLVSYAASIPADIKMKGLRTKYILKEALKNTLPEFILNKKKSGFNAPVGHWLGLKGKDEFRIFNKYIFEKRIADASGKAK